jgi:hypothetical protein
MPEKALCPKCTAPCILTVEESEGERTEYIECANVQCDHHIVKHTEKRSKPPVEKD